MCSGVTGASPGEHTKQDAKVSSSLYCSRIQSLRAMVQPITGYVETPMSRNCSPLFVIAPQLWRIAAGRLRPNPPSLRSVAVCDPRLTCASGRKLPAARDLRRHRRCGDSRTHVFHQRTADTITSRFSPVAMRVGMSIVIGFILGWALRSALRLALSFAIVLVLLWWGMSYMGWVGWQCRPFLFRQIPEKKPPAGWMGEKPTIS